MRNTRLRIKNKITSDETKLLEVSFDKVSEIIKDGVYDIEKFEEIRLQRNLDQNYNSYPAESRLKKRLQNVQLSLNADKKGSDAILFPWNFNSDLEANQESNLKTGFPYLPFLTHELLEDKIRTFFKAVETQNYKKLRSITESNFVKVFRKHIGK